MKVKFFVIFFLFFAFISFAEDCKYLEDPKMSFASNDYNGRFNYHFAIELCNINEDAGIHEDIVKYIQEIRENKKGKTIVELIKQVGNRFCRGQFGNFSSEELDELNQEAKEREGENATDSNDLFCNQNSFYHRFVKSCSQALEKTGEKMKDYKTQESPSADSIRFGLAEGKSQQSGCEDLAEKYIVAYKEVALSEVARYHAKTVENSNSKYFLESQKKMKELTKIWDLFTKIFANIARSFQGFTREVHKKMSSS